MFLVRCLVVEEMVARPYVAGGKATGESGGAGGPLRRGYLRPVNVGPIDGPCGRHAGERFRRRGRLFNFGQFK